jgi:hypothetical protein
MIHPGLEAPEPWAADEYMAGYGARLAAIPDSKMANHSWRSGWDDADTEALELTRHRQVVAEGLEDDYMYTWGLLFDGGRDARMNGIPFDAGRTRPWKQGWIAADIELGSGGPVRNGK